ncbi:MAG: polysaccharide biosynthesis protein [bacterium]
MSPNHPVLPYLARRLEQLPRRSKQLLTIAVDISILWLAVWFAYVLRLGEFFVPNAQQWLLFLLVPMIALPVFIKSGLYRSVIRYVSEYVVWTIVQAITLVTVLWTAFAFFLELTGGEGLPRSVPIVFGLLAIVWVAGSRFLARWLLWLPLKKRFSGRQILIYGAGLAGQQIATTLRQGHDFFPAGFLDDDPHLQDKDIAGLRVYSPSALPVLIERFGIQTVLVTLPSASQQRQREIVSFLDQYKLNVRILPALTDIANGKHLVNMLREVEISDLLGRESITADEHLLQHCIRDKTVMVTGAGGSIGAELCRQIIQQQPKTIILYDWSEYFLYRIEQQLQHLKAQQGVCCEIIACLGNVQDKTRLLEVMRQQRIHTLYHAAAYKHVPLVESNMIAGVENNVFGTLTTAQTAQQCGIDHVVLISTDKAVRPTNVMGATKRIAELCIQALAAQSTHTIFCMVRFGNVLGSSGSVVPLFQQQIRAGGPVTVTHPEVIRYFMTIPEASQLVIQAGAMSKGGDVFLLDMGEPVKIVDLARHMIRLSGLEVKDEYHPAGDIAIEFTGLRPGEKLYEELLIDSAAQATAHPRIFHAREKCLSHASMQRLLEQLRQACQQRETQTLYALLEKHVSGYYPPESVRINRAAKVVRFHPEARHHLREIQAQSQ